MVSDSTSVARPTAPEWLHLLPAGSVRTVDGRGPYAVPDAAALIPATMAGGKLPIDENHSIDLAGPKGGPSPARGWIVAMQLRADGIWGRVEWTEDGRRIMADRQYRGLSPVIEHRRDGTILRIVRASLTNTPNFAALTTLHSHGLGVVTGTVQPLAAPIAAPASDGLAAPDLDVIRTLGLDRTAYADSLHPADPGDGLTAVDLEMVDRLGLDRAAYAAGKAAMGRDGF